MGQHAYDFEVASYKL